MNGNNKTRKRKRQMELQSFKYERLFYDENNGIPSTMRCAVDGGAQCAMSID